MFLKVICFSNSLVRFHRITKKSECPELAFMWTPQDHKNKSIDKVTKRLHEVTVNELRFSLLKVKIIPYVGSQQGTGSFRVTN